MARKPKPEQVDEVVAGLACPKCQAAQIVELPPNGITPHPGYRCLACGVWLRGMTMTYIVVVILAAGMLSVTFGLVTVYGDDRDARIREYVLWFTPLNVLLGAFAIRQLFRPRPRRVRRGAE